MEKKDSRAEKKSELEKIVYGNDENEQEIIPTIVEEKPKLSYLYIITAYCKENYPHICNDGDSTYTATMTTPTVGRTIAVDPNIIPYGTKVEIEGIGIRVAEDCGGAIKGENKIDLLVETHQEALNFGRQTRQVTILN